MNRPFTTEEDVEKRFHKALNDGDKATLDYFAKFGKDIRKQIINVHRYEQYLACGYTGAPVFNEQGFVLVYDEVHKRVTDEAIFTENYAWHYNLLTAQHPNGKWIAGCRYSFGDEGEYSGASLWSPWYDTREEAERKVLKRAVQRLEQLDCAKARKYLHVMRVALGMRSFQQLEFDF